MKLLLAVDGSPYTPRMLAYLAKHEALIGATREFTVLTVVTSVPAHVSGYINRDSLQQYYADQAEAVLQPVRALADQHGFKATCITKVGHAAEVIAAMAKEGGYDLVVMGSHGQSPLTSLVMGSVTARVLALCPTAVMIVR